MNIKIIALFTTLSLSFISSSEEPKLPRFYLDYAVVQHSLKNDEGNFDEFIRLSEINRNSADFIAEFWWGKARRECDTFLKDMIGQYANKIKPDSTESDKSKIFSLVKKEANQCYYGIYYDNWNEINKMILKKFQLENAQY